MLAALSSVPAVAASGGPELGLVDNGMGVAQQLELDEAVSEAKAEEAYRINNGGVSDQLAYLCAGMHLEEAREYLEYRIVLTSPFE